ncbi:phosphoadenosine phosphosulfate reductase [Oceanicola sp. 502str15]|uniref:phosphoadenosine phosphosulfate reductase n=1 Tax=Oceanicola sp. 502str15 TaxID=2696061 RepID=UPI0020950A7E|nr:phosphoadenosine phosphosulfate reductase [Oceanicola sp. 502str15]MCO6382414.1 phosphoadenosine phosphosulfate reductase [Oceanicola sp. 502str15]
MTQNDESTRRARWRVTLDAHGAEQGAHVRLGEDHGALFTEDDEILLVTFEMADTIRDNGQGALPYGLQIAGREGCSQLCLYSETDGFFRSQDVFDYFDGLVDDGFFDEFDRVVFYGAGPCAYAAAAYSVCAPFSTAVLLAPLATLDPKLTAWDNRYPEMRRTDFTSRYGYAPAMLEAAEAAFVIHDPANARVAMHASLFRGANTHHLQARYLGNGLESELEDMGVLEPMLRAALRGKLTPAGFAHLYRDRHRHGPWLRRFIGGLNPTDRPWLTGLAARTALSRFDWPRFRKAFEAAREALAEQGRSLPPPGDNSAATRKQKEAAE